MITVGVHKNGRGFQPRWGAFLEKHGAKVRELDLLGPNALEEASACDGIMWHVVHNPTQKQSAGIILRVIEETLGKPVFPEQKVFWPFDNKLAQAYLMKAVGIPQPETWVFWRREDALEWARTANFPVVFKLAGGAGSTNVQRIDNEAEARAKIDRMFSRSGIIDMVHHTEKETAATSLIREARHVVLRLLSMPAYVFAKRYPPFHREFWMPQKDYAYFQEFLAGNAFDTRVTVIGDRAFAFRRFNRPEDFRASGSGRIDHDPSAIDPRCIERAFEWADKVGNQSMAFDLLTGQDGEPVCCEFCYAYMDTAVHQCPGHWDRAMNRHEGHMWPEEAHVIDLLARIRERASGRAG